MLLYVICTDFYFQEMTEFLGMSRLNERLHDPSLSSSFEGLLPRDNPLNTRFAINFFTSIGLGGLTDTLREFLRTQVGYLRHCFHCFLIIFLMLLEQSLCSVVFLSVYS